jgi:hypothetical protein
MSVCGDQGIAGASQEGRFTDERAGAVSHGHEDRQSQGDRSSCD